MKRALIIFVCAYFVGADYCPGEGMGFGGFSKKLGKLEIAAEYKISTTAKEGVKKQDQNLSLYQQGLNVLYPLRQNENFESALTFQFEVMDIATRGRLIQAGVGLPDHLWEMGLGGLMRGRLDNEWIWGVRVSGGSASDKPFDGLSETNLNATGSMQIPAGDDDQHLLFLNFATNREFLPYIPIPGYAYQWNIDRNRQALLGIPFCWGRWRAMDKLTLQGSYFIPRTVHAKISYELWEGVDLYSGFDWQNQRWFRAGREDDDDRIFYYEKKVGVGLQCEIVDNCKIDFQGGYGFDRFFFEGEEYDDRGDNRISFSDGFFLGTQVNFRF